MILYKISRPLLQYQDKIKNCGHLDLTNGRLLGNRKYIKNFLSLHLHLYIFIYIYIYIYIYILEEIIASLAWRGLWTPLVVKIVS